MVLIFGGAYQGKLDFALESFKIDRSEVLHCGEGDISVPAGKKVIYGIDKWILTLVNEDKDVSSAIKELIDKNAEGIIICDDISCGVVPVEANLRAWREAVGRALAELARYSVEVYRLFCGIPAKIK